MARLAIKHTNCHKLRHKVVVLDARIAKMGGTSNGAALDTPQGPTRPRGRRGPRASNKITLADALATALKGKTLSVSEAADAVQKAGYRTNSRSFRVQVNFALLNKKQFRRVLRGKYTAR